MVICITKYLLGEKHQLSKIWLAAHWEKKIKRAQIFEVDIERSVQDILEAEIILDLRISGHLLVGIVKIHSRKTKYLLTECNNIFYQVKVFRTGVIDLPDNKQTARVNDITLTEFLDNFDNIENDVPDFILTANQTHIEEITLKETADKLTLLDDDDMLDFVFHEDEPMIFDDFSLNHVNETSQTENLDIPRDLNMAIVENDICYNNKQTNLINLDTVDEFVSEAVNIVDEVPEIIEMPSLLSDDDLHLYSSNNLDASSIDISHKTSEKLYLKPIKTSMYHNLKNKKVKKRKLLVDYIKVMPDEVIKNQVLDTSDIISVFDFAPASRRLMILKEIGSAEQLFKLPVLKFQNHNLLKLYQRNLKTCKCENNFELSSEQEEFHERSLEIHMPRKKSRKESCKEYVLDENSLENLDSTSTDDTTNYNTKRDFPSLEENSLIDTEIENMPTEQLFENEVDHLSAQNILSNDKIQSNDIQLSQVSKISEERREYALQGTIIHMLQCLKSLFDEKSIICFSSIAQSNKKSWVAQRFLCLLMLKKFGVISLKQCESFGEIFISPEMNFDGACCKFCNF